MIEDISAPLSVTILAQPPVQAELNSAARSALNGLRSSLEESGERVELGELPAVLANPTQIGQSPKNRVGNALKFHRAQEPPVVRVDSTTLEAGVPGKGATYNVTLPVDGGEDSRRSA